MAADRAGRRVTYDKVWGALLLATCALPVRAGADARLWELDRGAMTAIEIAWLVAGSLAGVVGLFASRLPGRGRHLANFLLGTVTLALPLAGPEIWARYPYANPARLPVGGLGAMGWVMLVGLAAIYAGSGMRVVRPSQIAGQALGALGAFLLALFALLPAEGGATPLAVAQFELAIAAPDSWRGLVPFALVAGAVLAGSVNLVRTRGEIFLAKVSRFFLAAALLFWIALPIVEFGDRLSGHLPVAWGALRFFGPLFLALDGCVAFAAISFTRSND